MVVHYKMLLFGALSRGLVLTYSVRAFLRYHALVLNPVFSGLSLRIVFYIVEDGILVVALKRHSAG